MNEAFIHIKKNGDHFTVRGVSSCFLGHRIQKPNKDKPDGIFAEWSWNGTCLTVRNDRYGFQPLFYFANENEIAVSDSIHMLLAAGAPRELDDAGLATFLRLGHFLGDDTAFRAIRMLAPDAHLEWRAGKLKIVSAITIAPRQEMSRQDAMDAYIELFRAAIARRGAPQRALIIPLSGGRDSRHIVFELCRQGIAPDECITAQYLPGVTYKTEVETAGQVCAAVGVPHRLVDPILSQFAAEQRMNRLTNFTSMEYGWFLPMSDYLNEHAAVTYDGMAGDVLSAGHFLTAERHEWFTKHQFTPLFRDMQWGLNEKSMKTSLAPELSQRLSFELALERFETECRKHLNAPNPVGSFSIFNRTRRVACLGAYMLQPKVKFAFSPFLDHDLFNFLSSLPAEMYVDHNFHTDTIRHAYPQYADIPFAETKPGTNYLKRYRRFAREVVSHLFSFGTSRLVRNGYVLPRLVRCLVDARYAPAAAWLGGPAIYLTQLEETMAKAALKTT